MARKMPIKLRVGDHGSTVRLPLSGNGFHPFPVVAHADCRPLRMHDEGSGLGRMTGVGLPRRVNSCACRQARKPEQGRAFSARRREADRSATGSRSAAAGHFGPSDRRSRSRSRDESSIA